MLVLSFNIIVYERNSTMPRVKRNLRDGLIAGGIMAGCILAGAAIGGGIGAAVGARLGVAAARAASVGTGFGMTSGIAVGTATNKYTYGYRKKREIATVDWCAVLRLAFISSDLNQDERLSVDEFRMNSTGDAELIRGMDNNNNTFIEPYEFSSCMAHLNQQEIKKGHSRGRRMTITVNGQTVYDNGRTTQTTQDEECDQNSGTVKKVYYVPSQQVIYV